MRRSRLLIFLTAMATVLSGAFMLAGTGVGADTATLDYISEGWFARSKPPAPQVDVPCTGTDVRPQCGPSSATGAPTPQAVDTGAYPVASAGGVSGDQSDLSGDQAWAAFQWDLFSFVKADVEKFVVTLTQAPDKRGDTYEPGAPGRGDVPPIVACNIVVSWSAQPGSNPWENRPTVGDQCVAPTVTGAKFKFDLTTLAQTWVDGTGYGIALVPGILSSTGAIATTSADDKLVKPFQVTFAGYETQTTTDKAGVIPKVEFQFTPAPEEDAFGGLGGDLGGGSGGGDLFEEIIIDGTSGGGELQALPDLDIIPTDVGSDPVPEAAPVNPVAPTDEVAALPVQPAGADTSFPFLALLALLVLAVIAFWSTGTALGPAGDPVPSRVGGVSRVLAQRHLGHGRPDPTRGL